MTPPEKKSSFVLGVDLDGVCGDFYGALRPIVAEWLGVDVDTLSEKEFTYGLREWGVRDLAHYKQIHRYAVTQRELFANLPQIEGAGPVLRRLSDDGVHIRVITHRLFIAHFHQEAVRQTVAWLDGNGIPYWDLCFVKSKVEVGADLYVEDSPENIKAISNTGKPVIVLTNPTNESMDASLRANDWAEVEELVRNEIAEADIQLEAPAPPDGPANDPDPSA